MRTPPPTFSCVFALGTGYPETNTKHNTRPFLQAHKLRNAGLRLPGRFAQVKEEAQGFSPGPGDTEQNVQAA